MSGRPSMKFNSHPPNGVFIKAVTITVSRRAWTAQLGSAQLCGYILYKEGGDRQRERKREGTVCEQGSKGLGQSMAGRRGGLICPKGSSASYAF